MQIRIAITLAAVLAFAVVNADEGNEVWNWYSASFGSPTPGAQVILHSGTAKAKLSGQDIQIIFSNQKLPELKPSFVGKVDRNGGIKGTLKGFSFDPEPEPLTGTYRETTSGNCRFKEIILHSGVADGSMWVLSKAYGKCQ